MGSLQLDSASWEVIYNFYTMKVFVLSFLLACAGAAPNADAEADPQYGYALGHAAAVAPVAYHAAPAPNCNTVNEILTTQNCVPRTENICNTITVDTEEIEYVPLCKETTDVLCDAPLGYAGHIVAKREADAEATADADADAYYGYGLNGGFAHAAGYAHAGYAAPVAAHVAPVVASAVGHSVEATVKHACRSVTTKGDCTDVENLIPVTTCEAVTTTHVSEAVAVAPVVHAAPVAYAHHAAPVAVAHAGYAAHHY